MSHKFNRLGRMAAFVLVLSFLTKALASRQKLRQQRTEQPKSRQRQRMDRIRSLVRNRRQPKLR